MRFSKEVRAEYQRLVDAGTVLPIPPIGTLLEGGGTAQMRAAAVHGKCLAIWEKGQHLMGLSTAFDPARRRLEARLAKMNSKWPNPTAQASAPPPIQPT